MTLLLHLLQHARTHTRAHQWDERYALDIRRAGFLELVCVVNYGLPPLDPSLLTTAVDRCEYVNILITNLSQLTVVLFL